ncbi:hypothetical protein PB1_08857 [Bacillus methanolicus PB1]|uniref:Transposase n=1 Tax=Bacillus methanolicus PB1 TaxID=997296 RepID=I3E1T6_BACMT|nr:hypothetical protein PB1_08857 [Bacillus methanolicus PB1]
MYGDFYQKAIHLEEINKSLKIKLLAKIKTRKPINHLVECFRVFLLKNTVRTALKNILVH